MGGGTNAQVVELVDALASGASVRKDVKVRVLSWAPFVFPETSGNPRQSPRVPPFTDFHGPGLFARSCRHPTPKRLHASWLVQCAREPRRRDRQVQAEQVTLMVDQNRGGIASRQRVTARPGKRLGFDGVLSHRLCALRYIPRTTTLPTWGSIGHKGCDIPVMKATRWPLPAL